MAQRSVVALPTVTAQVTSECGLGDSQRKQRKNGYVAHGKQLSAESLRCQTSGRLNPFTHVRLS